jgi:hypothetical protein
MQRPKFEGCEILLADGDQTLNTKSKDDLIKNS